MSRIVIWVLSTITVVVLLFGYHTSTEGAVTASPPAIIGSQTTGPSTTPSTAPSTQPADPAPTRTPSSGSSTVTGAVAQTVWGPVQVRLTVENGRITAVDVPVYPNGNSRDYEINSYALPTLVQETLAAQSAQIDMVSGATVTSGGYLQSLQSALDQAGL